MVRVVPVAAFALLNTVLAAPPKHDHDGSIPTSLIADDSQAANISLVETDMEPPSFEVPMNYFSPWEGDISDQWRMPKLLGRQASCSSRNACGSISSTLAYCSCNQQCCQSSCCVIGATCNGNSCALRTVTASVIVTSTRLLSNEITITTTAVGGTVTITSSVSSVTVVTVSSADVATVVSLATVTVARRALGDPHPADIAEQPLETSTLVGSSYNIQPRAEDLIPQITQILSPTNHLEKRQGVGFSTVTTIIGTTTVVSTTTRLTTTTVAARFTATSYTTFWQTVTSVVNAKRTTTTTSTITLTPGIRSVEITVNNVVTTILDNGSTTTLNNGNNSPTTTPVAGGGGNGNNPPPTNKGLSSGAKAGIGGGAAGGGLLMCLILGFALWRRRKARKERDQEMINTAIASAMTARNSQPPPPTQYYDGKQLSTATTSPHPYSPTPPLHSPQPSYVYPPPTPMHNQHNSMDMNSEDQYRYSAPAYGGSEIDGNPVQRYELRQSSTPAPGHGGSYSDVPHPVTYAGQSRGGIDVDYSDFPEVRPADGPEVRR